MKREININIDLYKKNTLTYLLKKGDTTTLIFTIIADNKSFDLTGKTFQLNLLKNNNKLNIITNQDSFIINENVISVSLNPEALNVAGDGELELIIMEGTEKLSSFFIRVKIEADMLDVPEDSENYIDLQTDIQEVIDTINTAKNDLNEVIGIAGDITEDITEINTSIINANNITETLTAKIIESGTATETLTEKITEAGNIEITTPVIDYAELDTKYLKKDQKLLNLIKYNAGGVDYSVRIKQDGTYSRGFSLGVVKPDGAGHVPYLVIGENNLNYNGATVITNNTLVPAITNYLNNSLYKPTLGIYAFGGTVNIYNTDNKIIPTLLNTTDTSVFESNYIADTDSSMMEYNGGSEYYNATLNLTIDSASTAPVLGTVKLVMMDVNGNIDNTNTLNTYTNTKIIDTAINGTELILSKFMQNNATYRYLGIIVNLSSSTPATISGTLSMYQMRS